jgi:hypothetical protein
MKKLNLFILCLCFPILVAQAAVPSRIVYQGRLSKSGVGAAGRHTITVQFVDAAGTNLSQSQTFDVDVPTSGDFSLEIDHIPADADWINGLPKMRVLIGNETLTPDQTFSAAPYALVARNVENLNTEKVKLAATNSLPGSGLLSSWQSPTDPSLINSDMVLGPIKFTTNHGAEHGWTGKDPISTGTLSPLQTQGTALVQTSAISQTIQPTQPVVPLIVKGQPNTGSGLNMFEVWDNAAAPSEQFHIQGSGNAYFKGNVGIGTESPVQRLRIEGNDKLSLFAAQTGDHDYGIVMALQTLGNGAQNGPRLSFLKSNSKFWSMGIQTGENIKGFSIWEDGWNDAWGAERFTIAPGGNVGIGTTTPGDTLEVRGNVKVSNASTHIRALTPSNWGYSTSYPVVMLGPSSGTGTVSIGYDPSGNPNGSFAGDGKEVLFRNGTKLVTPNSANNAFYLNQVVLKDGNVGINKDEPTKTLDVVGDANITGKITGSSVGINNPTPTKALDIVGDANIAGKVGINNPAPTKTLDVVGDANISGKISGATFGFGGIYTVVNNRMQNSKKIQ